MSLKRQLTMPLLATESREDLPIWYHTPEFPLSDL